MKITLPLFNQAVRGILPDVGTFTNTPAGAVLRQTRTKKPPRTATTRLNNARFASEAARWKTALTNRAAPLAQTIATRLLAIHQPAPANFPALVILTMANPAYNLGTAALNRTTTGDFQP